MLFLDICDKSSGVWVVSLTNLLQLCTDFWLKSYIIIIVIKDISCHRPFLPGTSLEPAVIPTTQASSFTLQYFPHYVWCSKYSCLLWWIYGVFSWYSLQISP